MLVRLAMTLYSHPLRKDRRVLPLSSHDLCRLLRIDDAMSLIGFVSAVCVSSSSTRQIFRDASKPLVAVALPASLPARSLEDCTYNGLGWVGVSSIGTSSEDLHQRRVFGRLGLNLVSQCFIGSVRGIFRHDEVCWRFWFRRCILLLLWWWLWLLLLLLLFLFLLLLLLLLLLLWVTLGLLLQTIFSSFFPSLVPVYVH